jgi:predicted GNAT family acetyltransferase
MEPAEGASFLCSHWKFAKSQSYDYVVKLIERNGSAGVFVDGQIVAGITMNGSGMMTMLHTLEEHRNKGYAQMAMKYLIKILSSQNVVPCCTVESSNAPSIALQHKIGLKFSHQAYYFSRPDQCLFSTS